MMSTLTYDGNLSLSEEFFVNREVLQTEFWYDFRKGPRQILAGAVLTVFICIIALIP